MDGYLDGRMDGWIYLCMHRASLLCFDYMREGRKRESEREAECVNEND